MQIERLKQQLVEITADLQVKEKQLRNLRFKSLFDSPKRTNLKKDDLKHSMSKAEDSFIGFDQLLARQGSDNRERINSDKRHRTVNFLEKPAVDQSSDQKP